MELEVPASEAGWATTGAQEVGSQPDFRMTFARMATRLLREIDEVAQTTGADALFPDRRDAQP